MPGSARLWEHSFTHRYLQPVVGTGDAISDKPQSHGAHVLWVERDKKKKYLHMMSGTHSIIKRTEERSESDS